MLLLSLFFIFTSYFSIEKKTQNCWNNFENNIFYTHYYPTTEREKKKNIYNYNYFESREKHNVKDRISNKLYFKWYVLWHKYNLSSFLNNCIILLGTNAGLFLICCYDNNCRKFKTEDFLKSDKLLDRLWQLRVSIFFILSTICW